MWIPLPKSLKFSIACKRRLASAVREATLYYGIPEVKCFTAEFLDIVGADVPAIMAKAKAAVDQEL